MNDEDEYVTKEDMADAVQALLDLISGLSIVLHRKGVLTDIECVEIACFGGKEETVQ